MEEKLEVPKKPLYNKTDKCLEAYGRVSRRVDKLELVGEVMDQARLAEVMRIAREETRCTAEMARSLLQPFSMCLMTRRVVAVMCWQISGNRDRIRDREVQLYSGKPEELGWMGCVIAEHLHDPDNPGGGYRLRVLDGPAAGLDLYTKVPRSFKRLSDVLGATYRLDKEYRRLDQPREAVQMQALVYPEPGSPFSMSAHANHVSMDMLPGLDLVALLRATPKQRAANAALVATRRRKCPKGMSNPCHLCHVGYDRCELGTCPRTGIDLQVEVDLTIRGKNICQTQKTTEEA